MSLVVILLSPFYKCILVTLYLSIISSIYNYSIIVLRVMWLNGVKFASVFQVRIAVWLQCHSLL